MDIWYGLYPPLICTLFAGSLLLVELDASELELVLGLVFWSIGVFKFGHSIQKYRRHLQLLTGSTKRRRAEMKDESIELQDMGEAGDEGDDGEVDQGCDPDEATDEDVPPNAWTAAKISEEGKIARTNLQEDEAKMRGLLPQDHGSGDQLVEYDTHGEHPAQLQQQPIIIHRSGRRVVVGGEREDEVECCLCCGCCGPVVGCCLACRAYYRAHKFVLQMSFITGLFTGVFGGLFGTGGPPIIVFFALLPGLTKADLRTTASFIDLTVFPFRLLFGILLGVMKSEEWLVYLGVAVGSLAGAVLGDLMHHVVPTDDVMLFLMCLVLASAAMLCSPANGTTFGWVALSLFVFVPIMVVLLFYLRWKVSTFFAPGQTPHCDSAGQQAAVVSKLSAPGDDLEAGAEKSRQRRPKASREQRQPSIEPPTRGHLT